MFNISENFVLIAIMSIALFILIRGYNKAKSYGKLGILAWLQSVALTIPWLLFFAFFAMGIYLNFIGIIFLLLSSTIAYIYLGNLLRKESQETILKERTEERIKQLQSLNSDEKNDILEKKETEEKSWHNEVKTPKIINKEKPEIEPDIIPIDEEDLKTIKTIFGIDTFFSTESIPYQEGAIFKGNLRGEPEIVHKKLTEKLTEKFQEKYRLFLVETPEEKPVVIVLPSSNDPQTTTLGQKNLALVLFIATIFTSLEAMSLLLGFDLVNNWSRIQEAIPLVIGLWVILIGHEIGHHLIANKHKLRLSIPFFLPSWQIGSFGGIMRFESLLPNRSVLFDVSFAGPAFGGIISLLMLMMGFSLSQPNSGFQIPSTFFQGSILVGTLAKITLGAKLASPLVNINPLTALGWLGLVITALNLLPAGQLDGGRIIQAIYGRKTARRTTITTLIILGIVSLFNLANSLPLYWAIIILFLQRDLERPCLNELTEPDDTRAMWALLALLLTLITLIPLSPSLALRLGIGS